MGLYSSFEASAAEYERAAATLKQYLEDVGIFSAVAIDTDTNTVECTYNGDVVATFKIQFRSGGYYGIFKPTCGGYAGNDFNIYTSGTPVWLGKAANAVTIAVIGGNNGEISTQCVICKSRAGVPMICLHSNVNPYFIAITADCETTPANGIATTPVTNAFYSNLCGICTHYAGNETSAAASNVYRYVDRQTSVSTTSMSKIDIDGTTFISDGFFALLDL